MHGYGGKILYVDLSSGEVTKHELEDEFARKYIGGNGFGARLLYDNTKPGIDALGAENCLILAPGSFCGSPVPEASKTGFYAKSPLTGAFGESMFGGAIGPELKFAGYDALLIKGRASKWSYLWVNDDNVEIKDAASMVGQTTLEVADEIRKDLNEREAIVASIGPAGENLVYFAPVMNDEHRAGGRGGLGAIMGSKKLKAVVVSGTQKPQAANPERLKEVGKKLLEKIKTNPVTGDSLPKLGTSVLVKVINGAGILPYKNWQTGVNPEAEKISGEILAEKYLIRRRPCWGCPIGCGRVTRVERGAFQVLYSEGPEYESIWALGSCTGVSDLEAIIKANHYCDELGLDPISMGSTIACAMELVEKGCIPEETLQGLDLRFGNAAALVEAVWRTAYKVGFGKYLALGSKRLAEIFGRPELSMSVKGLEMPAYDPRGAKGIGLEYATSNRGGCHVTGYTISPEILGIPEKIDPLTPKGKAKWVKTFQDLTCVVNSAVNCLFTTFAIGAEDYAAFLSAIMGIDYTADDIMKIGERIYNLERVLVNKLGFDGKDDTLPPRLLKEQMPEGPAKGHVVELEEMKKEYYELRGWVDGKPASEKLKELEIEL